MNASLSIESAAAAWPQQVGLIHGERSLSFAELAERARVAAARLALAPGLPLAVIAHPDIDTVIRVYAALERGAPLTLLHDRATAGEQARLLAEQWGAQPGTRAPSATGDQDGDQLPPTAHALTLFTSGSAGTPRAVRLSRQNLLASAAAHAANLGWQTGDRWLCCLPLAHIGGFSILTRCLNAGAAVVLAAGADVANEIERCRITLASLVPTQLERLCRAAEAGTDLSSLRAVLVGGAACSRALFVRARTAGIPALLTYGMTETCSQIATMSPNEPLPDCWPVPLPLLPGVEARVVGGRLSVRGPMVMLGYATNGDRGDRAIWDDGWFETSDLGRIDNGRLIITGRADDIINTGGEKVSPREVEEVLLGHPAIADVCVVGIPDDTWGQRVAAAVVGRTRVDGDAITEFSRTHLAGYKIPRTVLQVAALPQTASGKVDRAQVAELLRPL